MSTGNNRITPTTSDVSGPPGQPSFANIEASTVSSNAIPFPSNNAGNPPTPSLPELRAILNNVSPQTNTKSGGPAISAPAPTPSNPSDFLVSSITGNSSSNIGIRTRHRSGTLPSRLSSSVGSLGKQNSNNPVDSSSAFLLNSTRMRSPSVHGSSIWSSEGSAPNNAAGFVSASSSPAFLQQQQPPMPIPQISTINLDDPTSSTSPSFNTSRVRSYSANNVLLKTADRQFLNHCSTIREEQPQLQVPQTQSQQILHPLQPGLAPPSDNVPSFLRPRSQTLAFQPFFSGFQNQLPAALASAAGSLGLQRRTQSFSEANQQSQQPGRPLQSVQPLLQDNLPETAISITSTHTNPSLGPTNTLLIINVPRDPPLTNAANFYRMMNQFGPIISVRVVACTDSSDLVVVVEFQDIESALRCKAKMNYQELVPGLSCIVSFAKIIFVEDTKQQQQLPQQRQENLMLQLDTPTASSQLSGHHRDQSRGTEGGIANTSSISPSRHIDEQPKDTSFNEEYDRFERICKDLLADKVSLSGPQLSHLSILIHRALRYNSVRGYGLGKLPEPLAVRKFDTPRLRDIRKQLDSNQLPRINVEELALAMYVELPELASDYLGNTIVQKLLEICSNPIRDVMIKHLLPYLAQMGAHKNGTWAAQKMINTVSTEREKWLISRALYKYFTQLFNDQYANYVVHGVLKFGGPYNDFIVEAMLATFMEIARNRFGARAIRTCLESDSISKEASVAISACVLTWCWDLMVDPNGSLLVTWFLDTCTVLPDRHCLLAKTLCEDDATDSSSVNTSSVSQEVRELGLNLDDSTLAMGVSSRLCKVCCSKLGHLSVLKVLNYRTDLTARDMILRRIFGDIVFECDEADLDTNFVEPPYLVRILTESSSNGPAFIYKVLSVPTLDPELRARIVHLVRTVLQDHNLIGSHQHKRLCEEVGLKVSTRSRALSSVSTGRRRRSRSRSSSTNTLLGGAPVSGTVDGSPTIGGHRHSRYSPPLSSQQTCGFSYDSATASNGTNNSTNKHSHTPNANASSAAVTGEFNGNNISPQFDYDMMLGSQFEKLSLNGGFTPRQFYHDRQQSQNSNRNGQSPGQQLFY